MFISTHNRTSDKRSTSRNLTKNIRIKKYDSNRFRFLLNNCWIAIGIGRYEFVWGFYRTFRPIIEWIDKVHVAHE